MIKESGITMTSVVVYVVLFFLFTSIAIAISSNMNYSALNEKGNIVNYENIQKLQFNLLHSAKKSTEIYQIENKLIFSNNDEYYYDSQEKKIIKNDAVLINNVENFQISQIEENNATIEVSVKKYGNEKSEKIFFTVGDQFE